MLRNVQAEELGAQGRHRVGDGAHREGRRAHERDCGRREKGRWKEVAAEQMPRRESRSERGSGSHAYRTGSRT